MKHQLRAESRQFYDQLVHVLIEHARDQSVATSGGQRRVGVAFERRCARSDPTLGVRRDARQLDVIRGLAS